MENPEIKALLKSAKDAIKAKEFGEALKICKSLIDKDKKNYLGWVFTGAAAHELGNAMQAQAAYQKAIEIQPNQTHAWQGLAQLYEKLGNNSELIGIYSELRKLFANDPGKHFDYSLKYANAYNAQSKYKQAIEIYNSLLKLKMKDKDYTVIIENLAKLLSDSSLATDQQSDIYFEVLESLKEQSQEKEVIIKIYENAIRAMINENKDWFEIEAKCNYLLNHYSDTNQFAIEILMQIYSEILIGDESLSKDMNQKLETIFAHSNLNFSIDYYKQIYTAFSLTKKLEQRTLSEFKKIIDLNEDSNNNSKILNIYLNNIYYSFICDHANTMKTAELGLAQLSQPIVKQVSHNLQYKFLFNQAISFYLQHKYIEAINLFLKISKLFSNDEAIRLTINRYLVECYLCTDNKKEALKLYDSKTSTTSSSICELLVDFYSDSPNLQRLFENAKQLAETNPEDHDCNFLLTKIAFELIKNNSAENYSRDELRNICIQANIKVIKLTPFNWEPVYVLGNFYKYFVKDYKKALKCYQKAYELCQNLDLCGLELVDCLLHEKENEIAFNVLKKANEEIENCKWASLRLGIIHLKKGDCNEAIRLFYNVIRNDPNDSNMWECLADAYLNRGSLTASLKSFNKAIELNPDSIYAAYQKAHIKQTLKLFDEAIIDYFAVLNKITNHIPTLKGLGETYYELASQNIKNATDNKYLVFIESSIKYLTKAICLRKDLCCLWKILGDCCTLSKICPKSDKIVQVPKCIIEKNFSLPETELIDVNKEELLKLSEESFIICCKLKPDCGFYWYDLGLNYFNQYLSSPLKDTSRLTLFNKSKDCLINSVNLEPENHSIWNSLGVLYASNNRQSLSQHCFIKSIKLNDSNAVTWTNLGIFYLINNDLRLAHECFKKSQAIDPEYSNAWIGQAFIAETVDIDQCIDLYRHAVELGLNTEAQYGYARIVSKISNDPKLKNKTIYKDYIEYLNAIPLASDCLIKYCDRIDTNADAYFLSGVLFEKLKLPLNSMEYYQKVFEIFNDEDSNELVLLTRRGYIRLLCEQKQYEHALLNFKKINVKNSLEDLCTLAKVFYKLGKYQQCCKIFESALNVCNEDEKSIVYTGMGMAQSKYNIQEAITSFFKSFQCKVICIQSLFALCSIGLLKNDMKLIGAVFKELDTLKESAYKFDIVKLKSIYYCLQKEFVKAIRCISKLVHEYPTETKSWIELCLCLKRGKYYDLALTIGNVIIKTNTQDDPIFYECIQFLLLKQLEKKQFKDNESLLLKMFQKMLHIFPGNLSSWSSFSQFLQIYGEKEDRDFKRVSEQINHVLEISS